MNTSTDKCQCGFDHIKEKLQADAMHNPPSCGACAEIIFTGMTTNRHTCTVRLNPNVMFK